MPKAFQREKTTNARIYESTHGTLMKMLATRLRYWEKNPETPKPWIADIINDLVQSTIAQKAPK